MSKPDTGPAGTGPTPHAAPDWTRIAMSDDHPNQSWREIAFNWVATFLGLGVIFALAGLYSVTM